MAKQRFGMKPDAVIEMAVHYFPSFLRSRKQALILDSWMHGTQYSYSDPDAGNLDVEDWGYGRPFSPDRRDITDEYENLRGLSPNNFAGLVVTTLAQTAYLEGISRPGTLGKLSIWDTFQRNRWTTTKQSAIHRGAIGQSTAYGVVIPGIDPLTGSKMSKMLGKSAVQMAAFYDNDDDEWPVLAIEASPRYGDDLMTRGHQVGWYVKVYDEYVIHRLTVEGDGTEAKQWDYIDFVEHGMPVPPVARCVNRLDLDGRARGEIEPVIPLLRRIDQDLFDRLINQRFGAWQVRYIAGMAKPATPQAQAAQSLRLRVEDLLVSTDNQTKFGTLPAGDIENQIKATDADLRLLSAISQTPPHHLLGLSANLQAEALQAASEGLQRKSFDFRNNAEEFHIQMGRLTAMAEGDFVLAAAWDLSARWRDTSSTSMVQAATALGTLAMQLKVPLEMLWERIPGWTDTDVERAKELADSGELEKILAELAADVTEHSMTPDQKAASKQALKAPAKAAPGAAN